MFFRRERPKITTFSERVQLLKKAGFDIEDQWDGRVKIGKNGIAALIGDESKNQVGIERAGIAVDSEIAVLVNHGYQMFWETPSGKRLPAMAEQLSALHQFEDDVKEALGLTNLYNTSLGTTSRKHVYDRVAARDSGRQPKPWEKKENRIVPPETKDSVPQ